jgi:hypothetical protein
MKSSICIKDAASCRGLLAALAAGWGGAAMAAVRCLPALQRPALTVARRTAANLMLAVVRNGGRLVAAGERGLIICPTTPADTGRKPRCRSASPSPRCASSMNAKAGPSATWAWYCAPSMAAPPGRACSTAAPPPRWPQAAQQAWDAAKPDPQNAEHPLNLLLEDARRLVDEGADKPFLDIQLRADGSVLVVGAYGLAFSSADGGRSWQAHMKDLPNPNGSTIYGAIQRQQEQYLFGEQGLLLHAAAPDAGVHRAALIRPRQPVRRADAQARTADAVRPARQGVPQRRSRARRGPKYRPRSTPR